MPLYHSCLGTMINSTNQEYYLGSNCAGVDGATNRTLTLANTNTTSDVLVYLDGLALHSNQTTITNNATASTVQFLISVWNNQRIVVTYIA